MFVAPEVSETTTLVFELTADDGRETDTDTVTITVKNVEATTTTPPATTAPKAEKKGSSGGSFGIFAIAFFSLMLLRRKYLKS